MVDEQGRLSLPLHIEGPLLAPSVGVEFGDALARQLETVVEYGLPDDYFNGVIPNVQQVTADGVMRAARETLKLDHLTVVVVGNRQQIESDLRQLPIGEKMTTMKFDDQFRLVPVE